MKTELEQLDYNDALNEFFFACMQYGARTVLDDFRRLFPDMHAELVAQINRPIEKVAYLFLAPPDASSV